MTVVVKIVIWRSSGIREYLLKSVDEYTTVLEALIWIRENIDPSLAFRYSCRMGLCGSCAMEINRKPRLACQTRISEVGDPLTLSPLRRYKVIKDLVPDLQPFFSKYGDAKPYLIAADPSEQENPTHPYRQLPSNVEEYLQFNYCFECGICYSECPVTKEDPDFLGPAALTVAYRYSMDSRDAALPDRIKKINGTHGIWECRVETLCSDFCPKGVDPSLAIQKMKSTILKSIK
jgi:succinate dehydrogenase / fumarate reductase iron-sulfur subunit